MTRIFNRLFCFIQGLRVPKEAVDRPAWRWRTYPALVLLTLTATFIFVVIGPGANNIKVGGDLPAFYGAGEIVDSGDIDQLYVPAMQIEAQTGLPMSTELGGLYFAYPPALAFLFSSLTWLDFLEAYVIFSLILLGAVYASVKIEWGHSMTFPGRATALTGLLVLFSPVWRSIIGSQLGPLMLLVLVVLIRNLERDEGSGIKLAGLVFLLLLKPQFGVPLAGLLLITWSARNTRAVLLALSSFWVANAWILGPNWVMVWLGSALEYQASEGVANSELSVSWAGVLASRFGADVIEVVAVGWVLTVLTVAVLVLGWLPSSRLDPRSRVALFCPGVLLLSPHSGFYDAVILLIPLVMAVDERRFSVRILFAIVALSWMEPFGIRPMINPIFPLVVFVFGNEIWRQRAFLSAGLRSATLFVRVGVVSP